MTGHKIKLPKGSRVTKDGKVVKSQPKLSCPAQYAKAKKQTWRKTT